MRSRPAVLVLLALLLLPTTSACSGSDTATTGPGTAPGTSASTGPTAGGTAPSSSTTIAATRPTPTDPPGTQRVVPYWMRDCPGPDKATEIGTCRVEAGEARLVPADADPVQEAMKALLAGPTPAETDAGLTTNIRPVVDLASLTVEAEVATADFNRYFETATSRPQVAQVVFTLTGVPAVKKVKFLIDHVANGATGVPPVGRDEMGALVPPISIDSPTRNGVVGLTFTVTGTARPTAGTVGYRVESPAGPTAPSLAEGKATLTAAAGARGPLTAPITLPAGTTGPVTLVLFQPNPTAGGPELTPVVIPLIVG